MRWSNFYAVPAFICLLACAAAANEVSLSAESLSVAEDGVTTYAGDVTLVVKLTTPVGFKFNASRKSETAEVLEGDVEIALPDLVLTTPKATVTRIGGQLVIKMDTATSRNAR